ncbi:hypothetical protein F5Y04DRAFT_287559 [Hypomontagnella monticulosa]|nr:hypothetical protein F5Y04DRAFT_287559 [Hypomontagnella monticulosa]
MANEEPQTQKQMQEQAQDNHSAFQATDGQAELLEDECEYEYEHKFEIIHNYISWSFGFTSESFQACPKCAIDPTCPTCLDSVEAMVADLDEHFEGFIRDHLESCREMLEQQYQLTGRKSTLCEKCILRLLSE